MKLKLLFLVSIILVGSNYAMDGKEDRDRIERVQKQLRSQQDELDILKKQVSALLDERKNRKEQEVTLSGNQFLVKKAIDTIEMLGFTAIMISVFTGRCR